MRRFTTFVVAMSFCVPSPAWAWGAIGHRITGSIAEENLSGLARANVQLILGEEDLAEASTWPDEMRLDPAPFWQKTANPWHYVTVREGTEYRASDAPTEGDAATALARFTKTLKDPKASLDERRLALRFIVHIIGDLHQPLHVGNGNDRGGNDVKVTLFGKPTNLHAVWDSAMIEQRALSYSEYSHWLSRSITAQDVIAWSVRDPAVWMKESIELRNRVYPNTPDLSGSYSFAHRADMERRLKQAGIRIAAYLNQVFEPTP